jgi:hypothetical protein
VKTQLTQFGIPVQAIRIVQTPPSPPPLVHKPFHNFFLNLLTEFLFPLMFRVEPPVAHSTKSSQLNTQTAVNNPNTDTSQIQTSDTVKSSNTEQPPTTQIIQNYTTTEESAGEETEESDTEKITTIESKYIYALGNLCNSIIYYTKSTHCKSGKFSLISGEMLDKWLMRYLPRKKFFCFIKIQNAAIIT